MDEIDTSDLIPDPECYWQFASYAGHVHAYLMILRHLYEPDTALSWLTSPQPLLSGDIPAKMILTEKGRRDVSALIHRLNDSAFS